MMTATRQKPEVARPKAAGRLFYVDNARTFAIVLVIALHVSISYGGSGSWSYVEPTSDVPTAALLTIFNAVVQSFTLGLLFLLAGYFTPGSYDRKGTRRFIGDRFMRLGIPLVAYIVFIDPIINYEHAVRNGLTHQSFLTFWGRGLADVSFGPGPLWFVQTLLLFSLAYAGVRSLSRGSRPAPKAEPANTGGRDAESDTDGRAGGAIPSNLHVLLFALTLGAISFLARLAYPVGKEFLSMQLGFYPQYVALFAVGVLAYRRDWLAGLSAAMGRVWLLVGTVGIALLPVLMIAGGALSGSVDSFIGGFHWQALAYAVWEQVVGVGLCVGLLVRFRESVNCHGRLARAMAAGSYTAYIIQAPVIVAVLLAARTVHVYPLVKFAVVAPVAVALCFGIAHFVRQLPFVKKIL